MTTTDNPFLQDALNTVDIRNGLSDIKADIRQLPEEDQAIFDDILRDLNRCQDLVAKYERTRNIDDHVYSVMELSGLEIKMTGFADSPGAEKFPDLRIKIGNFAEMMRRKFA